MVAGHEVLHYRSTFDKIFGTLPFTLSFYSHYFDEHTKGHHKTVGTPDDPSSATMGTEVHAHFENSWKQSHVNCWRREQHTIASNHDTSKMSWWSENGIFILKNRMTHYFIIHATIMMSIYKLFGTSGAIFHFFNSYLKNFSFISADYHQHYGLRRDKDEQGIYESISLLHSWNNIASPMYFRVTRHSDHHMQVYRGYMPCAV